MSVIVVNYGDKNGTQRLRVNGSKEDLQKYIEDLKEKGHSLVSEPEIELIRLNQCTMLVQLQKEAEKIGATCND